MNGTDDLIDRLADAGLETERADPAFDEKPEDDMFERDNKEFEPGFGGPAPGDGVPESEIIFGCH